MAGLRPTTDRTRETLFNWLQPIIVGADCLDLFSGSGCLAFEALSREAASATLIEQEASLFQSLKDNKKTLDAENATIIRGDALSWLETCQQKYDIIFLDPPFHQGLVEKSCDLILKKNCLKESAYLYIESEAGQPIPAGFSIHKQKNTAQVQYGLYTRIR